MVQKIMTPEEKQERKFRARCRFRATIRFVMKNIYWLKDVSETELTDNVMKNVAILTREKNQIFGLMEKTILNTPQHLRTIEDKLHLQSLIDKLRCFNNYPNKIKDALSNVCGFVYYPPGRVVIKQGYTPTAMFVVLSGRVGVRKMVYDPVLNEHQEEDIAIVEPGHKFGDASIINNIPRLATCRTLDHTQLIVITKDDFDLVLRETVQEEWNAIEAGMKKFPVFNGFNKIEIRECCMLSTIQHFSPMATIVGDGAGSSYYSYFIVKGRCRLIENLLVITTGKGKNRRYKPYKLPEDDIININDTKSNTTNTTTSTATTMTTITQFGEENNATSAPSSIIHPLPPNVNIHCLEICQMGSGYCFQLGENLNNRRICAMSAVSCLCIPRFWIFLHNQDKRWSLRLQFIERHIPNTEKVFQAFELSRRWTDYKLSLCDEVLQKRKKASGTKICDVPLSLRLKYPILYK